MKWIVPAMLCYLLEKTCDAVSHTLVITLLHMAHYHEPGMSMAVIIY